MAPTQREQIERLSKENADLKEKVNSLTESVDQLKSAVELLNVSHGEAVVRVEAVEENLCLVKAEQKELEHDLTTTMLRLEGQQMYSRKQTLLLTGSAVALPVRGEDTRDVVLQLLSTYLGVTGVGKGDISACHRLKNPKVILVRFSHMDNSDRIYKARTKPKRRGLLVFESLTTERLAVIEMIKALKNDNSSPVLSYFTQTGKIFIRTSESRDVKPIEIPFGCGPDQIRELCAGGVVNPTEMAIRDQFRAIHGVGSAGGHDRSETSSRGGNPWITVRRGRPRDNKGGPPLAAQSSRTLTGSAGGGPPGGSRPGALTGPADGGPLGGSHPGARAGPAGGGPLGGSRPGTQAGPAGGGHLKGACPGTRAGPTGSGPPEGSRPGTQAGPADGGPPEGSRPGAQAGHAGPGGCCPDDELSGGRSARVTQAVLVPDGAEASPEDGLSQGTQPPNLHADLVQGTSASSNPVPHERGCTDSLA